MKIRGPLNVIVLLAINPVWGNSKDVSSVFEVAPMQDEGKTVFLELKTVENAEEGKLPVTGSGWDVGCDDVLMDSDEWMDAYDDLCYLYKEALRQDKGLLLIF